MKSFNGKLAWLALFCLIQWVAGSYGFDMEASEEPVRFHITLTWEEREVAGFNRTVILSNEQFPAPQLRLRQGDRVEFLVDNQMPFSTTVHFHGTYDFHSCTQGHHAPGLTWFQALSK